MKINWRHIFNILKTGMMILAVVACLSGCKQEDREISGAETSDSQQEELRAQQRSCWQASVLKLFYDITATASLKAYPAVTGGALSVMMVAFAIWLSLKVLRHISAVSEESPGEIWTEVGRMAVACLGCGILASSTKMLMYVLNMFIFPIYYTFLELGSRILAVTATSSNAESTGQMLGDTCLIYTNKLVCTAKPLEKIAENSFPQGPSELMQCLACGLSDRMQLGFEIANDLFAALSLSSFIAAIMIYVIFTIVKISFVFYMVDSIFRMCMMIIILPFLVMAVPFKATRKWSKAGFETILNSSANMMCLAVIMTMAILAMQVTVQQNSSELGNKNMYQEFSIVMLSMILIAFLVLKSCGLAVSMAGSLVGGGGDTKFQKKIAKLAAWAGKALITAISAGAGRAFIGTIEKIEKFRKLKEKVGKARNMMSKLAGRDKSEEDA